MSESDRIIDSEDDPRSGGIVPLDLELQDMEQKADAAEDELLPRHALSSSSSDDVVDTMDLAVKVEESAAPSAMVKRRSMKKQNSVFSTAEQSNLEEFLKVRRMTGYNFDCGREIFWWTVCLLSGFMVWLLSVWFPAYFIPWRYKRTHMAEAQYILVEGLVHDPSFTPVERVPESDLRLITFRMMRYFFSPSTGTFELQQSDSPPRRKEQTQRYTSVARLTANELSFRQEQGLSWEQATHNYQLYSQNALLLRIPTIGELLFQEVFHPFNVFQIYSVCLWIAEQYYYFAGCIVVIATVSIVQTLIETRQRMRELARLAKFECRVKVLRHKPNPEARSGDPKAPKVLAEWREISSFDLVPGDLVQVQTGTQPCDIAVLDGGCVVNESMLTGESVPVLKATIQWPADKYGEQRVVVGEDQRSTIFSATKVLQLKPSAPNMPVVGVVVRTGFATTQGGLILSILFPKPSTFKFITQSYLFIGAMFVVSLAGLGLAIWQGKSYGSDDSEMVIHALDLITIVVPPSLPLALSVGTNFALVWLQKVKIFCISPARINLAGKVRLMCFDKTGTLTAESLEFKGVLPSTAAAFGTFQGPKPTQAASAAESRGASASSAAALNRRRSSIRLTTKNDGNASVAVDTSQSEPLSVDLKNALACCQSLALLDKELIGDPLEVQTFHASNASLQDSGDLQGYSQLVHVGGDNGRTTFGILSQFEFSSKLQRMSVLAENVSTKQITAFVKGSPEMIQTLSRPDSLPENYNGVLGYFARQGFRVIAIARKPMESMDRSLDKDQLRIQVEADLEFMGLVLLENKVKPESEPTLAILRDAGVRCVMVTGDNPLTAVTVAKECKLIETGVRVFQSRLNAANQVDWVETDDETLLLNPKTLELPASLLANGAHVPYELAVTGSVYAHLKELPGADKKGSFFHRVLINAQIFARMTPDQKGDLVTQYMGMGLYSGMCGDGANDCAALKAANIGVSLSESEASIAAPFTYQRPNIECIPILLSEGRSSLATSFQLFRYMCMYSGIQFSAALVTYFKNSVFGNWQYLYQDLWIVFPLVIFMGGTHANPTISMKRPSGNLLSFANVFNLFMHIGLVCLFQGILIVRILDKPGIDALALYIGESSDYYGEQCLGDPIGTGTYQNVTNDDGTTSEEEIMMDTPYPTCFTPTVMYYIAALQYVFVAIPFALGRPWKDWFWKNWEFTGWLIVSFASTFLLILVRDQRGFFRIDDLQMPDEWRLDIIWIAFVYFAVVLVFDILVSPVVVSQVKKLSRSAANVGPAYQRNKIISGSRAKEWWALRGQFESQWSSVSNIYTRNYQSADGSMKE